MTFDEFWGVYPHYRTRSKKVMARAKWDLITNGGMVASIRDDEGNTMRVTLQESPEVVIEGAKAYRMRLLEDDTPDYRYAAGAQVWLNQGRWEDIEEGERRELAARLDRILNRGNGVALRVVS